jgi:hypothetical protein
MRLRQPDPTCNRARADGLGAIASPRNSPHRASASVSRGDLFFYSKKVSKSTLKKGVKIHKSESRAADLLVLPILLEAELRSP